MRQITAIVIGAGLRGGRVYASYALAHPQECRIVAVAEPDPFRRTRFAREHGIPEEMQFASYEDILKREKLADCAWVCTQDRQHFRPVVMALEKGYHVLCEKPMAVDPREILQMGRMAEKYDRILSVCHVLRYSDFFTKIRELVSGGAIGRLICIQHKEQVGYWHHAHSFVRGNWGNAQKASPMILQKCCHDIDLLIWLAQSTCEKVSSFGELTYFRPENAPEDAPAFCLDGCPHRETCEFYAPRFYLTHPRAEEDGLVYAVSESADEDSVMEALRRGPYGRCVFHCDNTVVDHQVVNLSFANQVTASLTMCAFTEPCAREIHLMGTKGEIRGTMEEGRILLTSFLTNRTEEIPLQTPKTGHSGSDDRMMEAFVHLAASDGTGGARLRSRTDAAVSVESHLAALAAEESRLTGRTIEMRAFREQF